MTTDSWTQATSSTATLGHISEVASLYSTPMDDSISLSSNMDDTPTSSSSSFKTTTSRIAGICHHLNIPKKQAILAEAEDDDLDDDLQYVDQLTDSKTSLTSEIPKEKQPDVFLNKKINEIKSSLASSGSPAIVESKLSHKKILSPLEKVSNEAKEYWATIDLYNNSKVAFNKRSKSVRLKREKLNTEWKNLHNSPVKDQSINRPESTHAHNPDECKCVKCTISYHETLIKSGKASDTPKKQQLKQEPQELPKSNDQSSEMPQFEEKLFNIKSELVNLSETSLDVFQLLLQLSDTMLELNSQLNSTSTNNQSQSQLLFINQLLSSNLNIEQNFDLNSATTEYNLEFLTPKPEVKPHNRRIEDFLQKTIGSVKSASNTMSSNNNNGNLRSKFLVPAVPSPSRLKPKENLQQLPEHPENTMDESTERLIDNLYDKNSVTQFVDSFFNSNNKCTQETATSNFDYYSVVPVNNTSSGQYSNSDFIVDENPYQSIDEDFLGKVQNISDETKTNKSSTCKQSSCESSSLSSAQSSLSRPKFQNWINSSETTTKGPSSNSSSSGCIEGGSSIASSSNVDLSSLPSTCSSSTNITNESVSHVTTPSSFLANETQTINRRCLNNNDYNKMTDNLIQSYRQTKPKDISKTSKKLADIPLTENHLNTIVHSHQFGQQRSNSVNYKATPAAAIYATGSTRRKPSFKFDSTILNRVQTMEKTRGDSIDEEGAEVKGPKSAQLKMNFPRKIDKSNHQISLDSGIYLPSESEEVNSSTLIRS